MTPNLETEELGSDGTVKGQFRSKIVRDIALWQKMWRRPQSMSLVLRLVFLEPGFQLALAIRVQESVAGLPYFGKLTRRLIWYLISWRFGCDIDPQAKFAAGLLIPHPYGIIIGGSCSIGPDCIINQHVTLGRRRAEEADGPRLGARVHVSTGAVVLGDIYLGDDVIVGANAVVLRDVPAGCSAVGVPARNLASRSGN